MPIDPVPFYPGKDVSETLSRRIEEVLWEEAERLRSRVLSSVPEVEELREALSRIFDTLLPVLQPDPDSPGRTREDLDPGTGILWGIDRKALALISGDLSREDLNGTEVRRVISQHSIRIPSTLETVRTSTLSRRTFLVPAEVVRWTLAQQFLSDPDAPRGVRMVEATLSLREDEESIGTLTLEAFGVPTPIDEDPPSVP